MLTKKKASLKRTFAEINLFQDFDKISGDFTKERKKLRRAARQAVEADVQKIINPCFCSEWHNTMGIVDCNRWNVRAFIPSNWPKLSDFYELQISLDIKKLCPSCLSKFCRSMFYFDPFDFALDYCRPERLHTGKSRTTFTCEDEILMCSPDLPTELIEKIWWFCRFIHALEMKVQ